MAEKVRFAVLHDIERDCRKVSHNLLRRRSVFKRIAHLRDAEGRGKIINQVELARLKATYKRLSDEAQDCAGLIYKNLDRELRTHDSNRFRMDENVSRAN